MPNIIIREVDNTTAGLTSYSNFSVVVFGGVGAGVEYRDEDGLPKAFDENGIVTLTSVEELEKACGEVTGKPGTDGFVGMAGGRQIAYQLLSLGYTVLYKYLNSGFNISKIDGFLEPLMDRTTYDFRYILQPCSDDIPSAIDIESFQAGIAKVAFFRRDAFAICDLDEGLYINKSTNAAVAEIQKAFSVPEIDAQSRQDWTSIPDGFQKDKKEDGRRYVAFFAPYVIYKEASLSSCVDGKSTNKKFPAGFHYLICAKNAFNSFAEWYAVAGYTRGVSPKAIESLGCKFGDTAINKLQPRYATIVETDQKDQNGQTINNTFDCAINVITEVKGTYYMWGNRTAHRLITKETDGAGLVASSFLNIRQLCCTLKKEIYRICRALTFNPNSDQLWLDFKGRLTPLTERMVSDQGIGGYSMKRVAGDKQKAKMYAKITISPIEAVEDFDIEIALEDNEVEVSE